ncbi:tetratricopeptide repeat protein [Aestuariivivens sediminicola]|uniref:type IX secretion system periplasmic lipoprotein PorW/SprE n=1 Tax=Aestuariivivens sediminicola TaxID=2913560 RepID=UPI001F594557|nr:tetratricopeptide repeat protein [Aestuariivivens sediminicola]
MKSFSKGILAITISIILLVSCSRKKDNFISRNYHAVTTEFNTLYNGYLALEDGRLNLNESYQDNYWDVLPIERMEVMDVVMLPGQSKNENFNRAEEKAVKAIQKHSMNIDGREKNPQIDEAYLLLGKARYFDQRFVPAIEAFNYILYKYPASDKINQAKIWREKTNLRLENDELALKNLKRLLRQEDLEGQDLADATSTMAQAYLNLKALDTAIAKLEIASVATKSNDERGRYRFIQGQLYNALGYKDSANIAFDRVIELNRKTPRIYMISAYIEKIKNFDYDNGDKLALRTLLTELEENRENRPYLDKIYHQIAVFHDRNQSDSLANVYYNKSLRTNSKDQLLIAKNYQILGDKNFDASLYREAGQYYDSTMNNLVTDSKPYRVIKKKRDNLIDVIYYEDIAQVNDSLLHLINLPESERLAFFEAFTDSLEQKAKKEKELQEANERNKGGLATVNNNLPGQRMNMGGGGLPGQGSTFYFYNPTTVAYGKNEFVKIWGNRTLEDNWRWSSEPGSGGAGLVSGGDLLATATEEERYDPQFYISKIPSEEKEIDSIWKERNYAYYQLGLIYKEKFKEYELAKGKFQELLKSNPEERLILPSKYNLFKIYELIGASSEALIAKEDIIKNYPDSRYATILSNPELASLVDENSPEVLYEKLYELHEDQQYETVIQKCEDYINAFDGEAIVSKFELLKATAVGRLYGFEPYKEAINFVAVTYANTPEGIKAQEIQSKVMPQLSSAEFIEPNDSLTNNYKVVFQFKEDNRETILGYKQELDTILKNIKYYDLKSSMDVYDPNTTLILVHGIRNKNVAQTFDQLLRKEERKKITKPYFVISSDNYRIVQIHKNLNTFLNLSNN